jgi:hypothetical protein
MQMSGLRADASAGWVFGALDELKPRKVWSADPHIGRDSSTGVPGQSGETHFTGFVPTELACLWRYRIRTRLTWRRRTTRGSRVWFRAGVARRVRSLRQAGGGQRPAPLPLTCRGRPMTRVVMV